MYIKHFGLAQYPFSLTPNTRFFLKLMSHQEAFNQLLKALESGDELCEIGGEVGTGKTMLCRKVLNTLEFYPDRYVTAYIPNPILDEQGTLQALAEDLDIETPHKLNYRGLLKTVSEVIVRHAKEKKRIVLFVDEAQAMPDSSLKAIYLLTQIKADNERGLQVVLIGQPELDKMLTQPELNQLQEKINFRYYLPTLSRQEMEDYVQHRLRKAGYSGSNLFTKSALDKVFSASKGTPRLISILCHKSMMVAYGKGESQVTAEFVESAMDDTDAIETKKSWPRRLLSRFD